MQSRESINQQINERYKDILQQYTKELDHIHELFDASKDTPPVYKNYPPIAGAIAWARDLYQVRSYCTTTYSFHSIVNASIFNWPVLGHSVEWHQKCKQVSIRAVTRMLLRLSNSTKRSLANRSVFIDCSTATMLVLMCLPTTAATH
jgi:Dynein heavy chain, N-terminal region 1